MARVYATAADYTTFTGDPAPEGIESLLYRASRLVESLTITARYTVDADHLPTDALVREAFKDATCAQAAWFDETGDTSGASARYNSMSLGNLSLSGGGTGSATNTSASDSRYAPEAVSILRTAGLLNQAPG